VERQSPPRGAAVRHLLVVVPPLSIAGRLRRAADARRPLVAGRPRSTARLRSLSRGAAVPRPSAVVQPRFTAGQLSRAVVARRPLVVVQPRSIAGRLRRAVAVRRPSAVARRRCTADQWLNRRAADAQRPWVGGLRLFRAVGSSPHRPGDSSVRRRRSAPAANSGLPCCNCSPQPSNSAPGSMSTLGPPR